MFVSPAVRRKTSTRTSDELLVASHADVDAFAEFYRRHVAQVHAFLTLRLRDRERAADLTAEVFAAVLAARRRYRPSKGPATAWLFAIARNQLIDAVRRDERADRARRALGMPVRAIQSPDLSDSGDPDQAAAELLAGISESERDAVTLRILHDRGYDEIAEVLGCSEQAARQRVSRGLSRLRLTTREA